MTIGLSRNGSDGRWGLARARIFLQPAGRPLGSHGVYAGDDDVIDSSKTSQWYGYAARELKLDCAFREREGCK
jgi:hypothetical protein